MATLRLKKPVIAITGSAGKSTTKEMIASILGTRWRVFKSKENRNTFPCTKRYAVQIRPYHQAVVLEYGMIYPGRIKLHCSYIQPNIGIITMIGTAHIGNFGGIAGLIRAKSELITNMNQNGTLFLNADDPNSKMLHTKGFKGKIIKVGIFNSCDYRAKKIRYENGGMRFQVELAGKNHDFDIPVPGNHNVYNALFAIAAADRLGFKVGDIQKGLRAFKRLTGRLKIYWYPKGIRLIDDSFSANPNADKAAIDVLKHIGRGRKVAVLGSMLELGKMSEKGHIDVGHHLVKREIDYINTYGKGAEKIGKGAVEYGFDPNKVQHFVNRTKLNQHVYKLIRPQTTILVKGSHDLQMHKTVAYLRSQLNKT